MADAQVFITIEQAMTRLLASTLMVEVEQQLKDVGDNPAQASRALDDLNFGPAVASIRDPLELLAANAVLLGAAQFTERKEVRLTRFVRDLEIPAEVALGVQLMIQGVDGSANELVRQEGQRVLQVAEAEDEATPITGISGPGLLLNGKAFFQKQGFSGLSEKINSAVASGTRVQSSVAANLTTSRMMSLGALSQASGAGIKTYQWNAQLDSKTCPFCTGMHGKVFSVGVNLQAILSILRSGDPGVAQALSPWPKQTIANLNRLAALSSLKLQEAGFSLPPAHPRCRCIASIVGSVPSSEIRGFATILAGQGSVRQQLAAHRAGQRGPPPGSVSPDDIDADLFE